MAHVTLKEILRNTREAKYGVPCPAGSNLEMIIGIIRAAEELRAPVIICYNQSLTPDIPIDMTMPIMTGDVLARKIKSLHPDIPVIMCTGFSEIIDEEKAKKIDLAALLNKPVIKKDLLSTIRNVLDQVHYNLNVI